MNVSAGIAMNILSNVLKSDSIQLVPTFFGSIFEHCSSRPLWICSSGMIRVTPPDNTHYYNFAWGNHGGNKTNNKAEATRQQNNAARDKRAQRYSMHRDQAFDEANFIKSNQ